MSMLLLLLACLTEPAPEPAPEFPDPCQLDAVVCAEEAPHAVD
jgi:hypothetical protein